MNQMKNLTEGDLARVDVLLGEVTRIKDIASGADDEVREELKLEQTILVAQINRIYGTEHVLEGSKITVINNDLNHD